VKRIFWKIFVLVISVALAASAAVAQTPSTIAAPPVAKVRPVVDDYFGTKITDQYRYMERLDDPEVAQWMKDQNAYTQRVLESIPVRKELLARIEQLDNSVPARISGITRLATGRYFYLKLLSTEAVSKLYMRDGIGGKETLLVDPLKVSGDTPSAINYFWPSRDGRYVAYGISIGGSEKAVLRMMDTSTTRDTGEAIDRVQFGDIIGWLPDSHSFVYNRLPKLGPHAPEVDKEIKSRAYLHVVGTQPERDRAVFGYGVSPSVKIAPEDISFVATFPEVPFAFGVIEHGSLNEISIYSTFLGLLGKRHTPWHKICDVDDAVTAMAVHGDYIWLLTHKNASRFEVIRTRLSDPDVKHAQVVVASSEAVVTSLYAAQDALYVQVRDGAKDRLLRISYESDSKPEAVTLPYDGSIGLHPSDGRLPGIVFELSAWTKATRVYEYDPNTKTVVDTKLRPSAPFDNPDNLESEEVKVAAPDGTLIPLSIIHQHGLKLDGSNPLLLNGYGSYGSSLDPYFDPVSLAWLERGGVLAYAHVRGGGEYGDDWHKAGQKLTKANTWHDFIACADYLIDKKYTSPARLAGEGESAGGILIGRSITERPELFAAALIEVGFTDALRGELEQDGPGEIWEWGTVKDRDGFKGLYEMSTYAHVKDGVKYPAVMLTTGRNDPRVAPWESAKMTARLQAATTSGKPVLLRMDYDAGHGVGSTKTQVEQELADEWSFLLWQFGVAAP
jgi:prolyl oligopeptidase